MIYLSLLPRTITLTLSDDGLDLTQLTARYYHRWKHDGRRRTNPSNLSLSSLTPSETA
ncbi:Putative rna 3'-terminal phosphate cyclase [Caligus rogercresseyi]|uniref:Rna 3'-terminal phosphate cyclase n=1 Tax=Caligus rogercresseyi TaxID=217165 RepID=A0A7T8HHZ8_CALRO|nr:Putative rna 3'-terminal phosphate cyclase [Caligus rogercresseyi]